MLYKNGHTIEPQQQQQQQQHARSEKIIKRGRAGHWWQQRRCLARSFTSPRNIAKVCLLIGFVIKSPIAGRDGGSLGSAKCNHSREEDGRFLSFNNTGGELLLLLLHDPVSVSWFSISPAVFNSFFPPVPLQSSNESRQDRSGQRSSSAQCEWMPV